MMAWAGSRPCGAVGCSELVSGRHSRCDDHRALNDKVRGAPSTRGYGADHRATRAQLLPQAIDMPCPLCGLIMQADDALDLDHSTPLAIDRSAKGDRIVHAGCNRGRRN